VKIILFTEKLVITQMISKRKVILDMIISEIKSGKNPSKISKENNIKKQTLNNYIRQLKKDGVLKKIGYGSWEVLKEVSLSTKATKPQYEKQIRGHAFNWKIKLQKNYNWERKLDNAKMPYQLVGVNNSTPRIIFNNKKVWLTKTGLVIYEPQSFFSKSSLTSKGMAVWELDKTIKMLGKCLKIDTAHYLFTTSREHYGLVKNELAKQYNDKGEKLYIRDDKGLWMWIDDSHSLSELETNEPKNSRGVQNWYNDMKKTDFQVTPSFLLETINGVAQNQVMFDKNFQSHLEVINKLGKAVDELREEIKRLKDDPRR
jgi:hypothetical protein